ncbi:MAG TPA: M13 family metallopeptidase [Opitutaceae bacterium]
MAALLASAGAALPVRAGFCACGLDHHAAAEAAVAAGAADREPEIPRFRVENMDTSADPRADFYQFAAGGWLKRTPIPADKSRWGGFDELQQRNWWNIRAILEEAAAHPGQPGTDRQRVGDLFAAALDGAAIDARGAAPVRPLLAAIDTASSVDELMRLVAGSHLGLGSPLFGIAVYADQKNSAVNALYLRQGGLSLPSRDYYFADQFAKQRDALREHIAALFQLAGDTAAEAQRKAGVIFDIERTLAENSKTPTELRDRLANYHKFTVAEVKQKWPELQLAAYFEALGLPPAATELIVGQPEFFDALAPLIATRPLGDWQVYVQWHVLAASAPYLSAPFETERFRFTGTTLSGTPAMEPRWQRAAQVIDGTIGEALGRLYVEKHFPPAVKARLMEMIGNIEAVVRDRLATVEWMTPATREKALAKFAAFRARIGYPDTWQDYSAVVIKRDDYYGSVVRALADDSRRDLAKIGRPVDKGEFSLTPQTVNAYYTPTANQIVFLAGILQPPFFDPELDDAVNYGAIGAVIGHEITHGFDDQGRRTDPAGNLVDWWTPADDAEFKRRAQMIIDQYNGYEALPGVFVNGQLTLGENIADLGGVTMAYEAFQRSLEGKPAPAKIDGFTAEQRFFLSWAQQWRTRYRNEAMARQVATNPHAPGNFRAVGPLVNFEPFFAAFGIKEGDPMWRAPEKRAKIW